MTALHKVVMVVHNLGLLHPYRPRDMNTPKVQFVLVYRDQVHHHHDKGKFPIHNNTIYQNMSDHLYNEEEEVAEWNELSNYKYTQLMEVEKVVEGKVEGKVEEKVEEKVEGKVEKKVKVMDLVRPVVFVLDLNYYML